MVQSNALELAKKGDPKAIAQMFNQTLNPKGITVRAIVNGGILKIALDAKTLPPRDALVLPLQKALIKLSPESIHTVSLYGMQAGGSTPIWTETFPLSSTPVAEAAALSPTPAPEPILESLQQPGAVETPATTPTPEPVVAPVSAMPEPAAAEVPDDLGETDRAEPALSQPSDPEQESPWDFISDLSLNSLIRLGYFLDVSETLSLSRAALQQAILTKIDQTLPFATLDPLTLTDQQLESLAITLQLQRISQMSRQQLIEWLSEPPSDL
jgi:hypothetical protein